MRVFKAFVTFILSISICAYLGNYYSTRGEVQHKVLAQKYIDPNILNNTILNLNPRYKSKSDQANDKIDFENTKENKSEKLTWIMKMEEKYANDLKRIKSVCQKYTNKIKKEIVIDNILVDTHFKWGYCGNPKAGTTTWVAHLIKLMTSNKRPNPFQGKITGHQRRKNVAEFFKTKMSSFKRRKNKHSITKSDFNAFLLENSILLFSFVRHPFERLVATYLDKCSGADPVYYHWSVKYRTFPDFIEFVLKQHKENNVDVHVKTFAQNCQYCNIPYNVIGRMESFQEDVKYIIIKNHLEDILPLEETLSFHRNQKGKSSKRAKEKKSLQLFSQLAKSQIRQLYDIYKIDFKMFNYDASAYFKF